MVGSAKLAGSSAPAGLEAYRGTSLIRKRHPLGPCSRHMRRALCRSWGGAVSYERGTFEECPVRGWDRPLAR